ncbi:MAG: DUF4124 domain-containing protein [Sedimenticola sp.]|nr:DUF4124 domain-containing protein [Sedimenticola sp.]
MFIRTVVFMLFTVLWLGSAEARMYRWVDENGVTVYSQSPPATGQAEEVKVHTSTAAPAPQAPKPENPGTESDNGAATDDGPSKEEIAESSRIKAENCQAARHNLDLYTNLGNKLVKTPDGLYKRLSEEERQEKIRESQRLMDEYCTE